MGIIVLAVWVILFCLSLIIPTLQQQGIAIAIAVVGVVAGILMLAGR